MGGNGPEGEKVLETIINTGYYRLCLVVTTTCAKGRKSSPTLSARQSELQRNPLPFLPNYAEYALKLNR